LAGPLLAMRPLAFVVAGLAIPVGAWSLVARFRRAGEVERQQLRWLVVVVVAVPVALAVAALAAQALTGNQVDLDWLPGICLAVLLLRIGTAILRYRLYELDRIISRTLAYGLLTLLLGGGYTLVVLGLARLLGRESPPGGRGRDPGRGRAVPAGPPPGPGPGRPALQPAPLRRRPHVEAFAARLRDQVDLDALHGELLAVVKGSCSRPRHHCGCAAITGQIRLTKEELAVPHASCLKISERTSVISTSG
jgi:hypothetical protein